MTAAKAYVALIGAIATALLNQFGPAGTFGTVLTVVAIVATAVTTWAVPNGGVSTNSTSWPPH